ncbi:MAG: hypothetical protein AB7N76_35460 [Planctomycetota bacterium]
MVAWRARFVPLLLLLSITPTLAIDCGRLPTGKNPSVEELAQEIAKVSAAHQVPTEVIKAIAWRESNCQQWRADGSFVHNKTDCGLGMMQLTGATAKQFDVEKLKDDWRYNLECGVKVLVEKWQRAERKGQVPNDPAARRVLENWYYPVAYYYGAQKEDYLVKVFEHLEKRPGVLQRLLARGVKVTLASEAIPGFKWGDKFRAWPEDVFEDAAGKKHKAPTHPGTIGDPQVMAALETWVARGKKALEKGKTKEALKYLLKVLEADLDTPHKDEARELLKPVEEATRKLIEEAKERGASGDKAVAQRLLKKVARDWKGHPLSEEAQAAADALK